MKKTYYLFNPGRMSRKDNTLKFEAKAENGQLKPAKYLPIEGIEDLYIFGSIDANSALYNFLGKQKIACHFFDYYEHYTGSFMPKEYLLAGKVQLAQAHYFSKPQKRIELAQTIIQAAAHNMLKNLRYYNTRGKDLASEIQVIETFAKQIEHQNQIDELMGIEGNIRQVYYTGFAKIINQFEFSGRNRQPPRDPVNVLISFGNMMCYTTCLGQIYHTQLNPTISFLHQPGYRRYSLALDIAEIFKPLLVDRVIFKVINKQMLTKNDFDQKTNYCTLKNKGKKKFIAAYEERLKETIRHRSLKRNVSYKYLIRLECYKLIKHILKIDEYKPFKAWW